ncbi:MAG TPA: FAD-dependent oxidoreductase [Pseudomonadales bacterium]|nr:FAD-dependent oxidoreductase [Pseudomonadales bacterium]
MRTYPEHERPCGWNALLTPRVPEPALSSHLNCELAVVGAGYTGLAAARRWAEARPDDRVCVLEASTVGEGSPGRNSGFMLEIALAEDADASAVSRMTTINGLCRGAMRDLAEQVERFDIDCGLVRRGTYRAAATDMGAAALDRYRRFLEAAKLPHEVLEGPALAERIGTHHYRVGLHSPDCWLVQPAALIRGLADHRPASVTLHERSPVTSIKPHRDGGWVLRTEHATVRAARVILANNAFAGALGFGASRLTPVYTYAGLTSPLPAEALAQLGSDPEWGLLPTVKLGATLRRTADGRLLARSQYSYRRELPNDQVESLLKDCLQRRFPQLGALHMDHVWGGTTGVTLNGAPEWGEPAPGLFVSAGCNGGGVVKGTLLGGLLAGMALDEDVPDVSALFGRASLVPPDPLRRIGFSLMTWRWRRQTGAEA